MTSSYRPHNSGHDYYAPGIYLITLVVRNRHENMCMFGHLNDNLKSPDVEHSDIGKAVMECWNNIPAFEETKGRKVIVHSAVCMPDHFHGVIEVAEKMPVSLGQVIWGFKVACTKRWREIIAKQQPMTVADTKEDKEQLKEQGKEQLKGEEKGKEQGKEQLKREDEGKEQGKEEGKEPEKEQQKEEGKGKGEEKTEQPSLAAPPDLHRMSKKQRAAYYAMHPEAQQPLWDDNYDDTICLSDPKTGSYDQRHFTAMRQYIDDNARRAIIRRLFPQFMQRCQHVRISGYTIDGKHFVRDYAAFGNLFLLRWARKVQVHCHRLARLSMLTDEEWQKATASMEAVRSFENHARTNKLGHFDRNWYLQSLHTQKEGMGNTSPNITTAIDYTRTTSYREELNRWVAQIMEGATVIVTPGISRGERRIKDECIEKGYPLIHIQKEPIGAYWKPERTRFEACSKGCLLILAPWKADKMGTVNGVPQHTDYSVFHNLNRLAEEICLFEGDASIIEHNK